MTYVKVWLKKGKANDTQLKLCKDEECALTRNFFNKL